VESELVLIALCQPGLEPGLAEELRAAGIATETEITPGGVQFGGDLQALYRANLECGLATQVLVVVAEFGARSLLDLDQRGGRVDWGQWLAPGTLVTVKARCKRSRIYHSGAAAERIEKHLAAQLGAATAGVATADAGDEDGDGAEDSTLTIRLRIDDNRCRIALDTSGAPLHRRGWRLESAKAPLREDLARALLLASGWDRCSPVLDPMMGSGTILIEAAILASGMAPGRLRTFACERFARHDARLLRELRDDVETRRTAIGFSLFGSDRDAGAVEIAGRNAARAGVADHLRLRQASLSASLDDLPLPPRGALVTNPPYGKRTGEPATLLNLYQTLGQIAGRLPTDWRIAMMVADRRLARRTGLELDTALLAESGGSKVRSMIARR
jgi:putative N6-adenine-specific DNA methylase